MKFQVHRKENQKLKYLNKVSTHTKATFNEIPSRIFKRILRITSRAKKNAQMRIDENYQGYANALTKSDLAPKIFPSIK